MYIFKIKCHVNQFHTHGNLDRLDGTTKHALGNSAIELQDVSFGKLKFYITLLYILTFSNVRTIMLSWSFVFYRRERNCGKGNVGRRALLVEKPFHTSHFYFHSQQYSFVEGNKYTLREKIWGILVCYFGLQIVKGMFVTIIECWVEWRLFLLSLLFVYFNPMSNIFILV